jgi:hypothetical protein
MVEFVTLNGAVVVGGIEVVVGRHGVMVMERKGGR